jgi:hypothetical protein
VKDASIVLFSSHGVATLRSALHSIWETVSGPGELIVIASHPEEAVATYLTRQYLRGRISGYELDDFPPGGSHCGLDRAFHVTSGKYLVRCADDVRFAPEWLEKTIGILNESPDIGYLSLVQAPGLRKRGRPRKVREEPEELECLDSHCFVTRHRLFERHECELMGEQGNDGCLYQACLKGLGYKLAYLPGQARRVAAADLAVADAGAEMEADLPYHEGATGALQRLRQTYQLGDEVLVTCMACGANELDVLSARIDFCQRHNVAIGFTYELRCQECHELHYEPDMQFRCPT